MRRHASWARMWFVACSLHLDAKRNGVAVELLRYQVRGWNAAAGREPAPVRDTRAALDSLRAAHPGVPIVLLGHSMGGRTANVASDDPDVVGVVALAPWFPPGEPVRTTPLLVLHGGADRWTSAAGSRAHVGQVVAAGGRAAWFPVEGGHFMLSSLRTWHRFAREGALGLLGVTDLPPDVREALEASGRGQSPVR